MSQRRYFRPIALAAVRIDQLVMLLKEIALWPLKRRASVRSSQKDAGILC